MTGCIACGAQTPGRKCRDCRLAERYEADDPATFETETDEEGADGGE